MKRVLAYAALMAVLAFLVFHLGPLLDRVAEGLVR